MHNNRIKIGHVSNLLLYKIVMNKYNAIAY